MYSFLYKHRSIVSDITNFGHYFIFKVKINELKLSQKVISRFGSILIHQEAPGIPHGTLFNPSYKFSMWKNFSLYKHSTSFTSSHYVIPSTNLVAIFSFPKTYKTFPKTKFIFIEIWWDSTKTHKTPMCLE